MEEQETFTQWVIRGFRKPSGFIEGVIGLIGIACFGSLFTGILISPWVLVITIPLGLTVFLHGFWRDMVKK